MASIH